MLRVANIIEEGKLGGPQVRIAAVAQALKPEVETTVIMPVENSENFRSLLDNYDIPYKTLHLSRITKEIRVALRCLFFSWYEIIRLVCYFRKEKFDLVHVSGGSWQYKGLIAGKLARLRVVWHLNDTYTPKFIRQIFSFFSRYADAFIFASERTKSYYGPLIKGDRPGFVIPAPVDTSRFDPKYTFQADSNLLKQWAGKTVIGIVANINPIKGLETFIRSAALLNKEFDDLIFVVVGQVFKSQQRYFESLQGLCDELAVGNIHFVGSKKDVRPFLQRFNLYVCSSLAESSPISVWEAMSMELPVVSTDVGDVPLYIDNGVNGFVVDVGDSEAMAWRIAILIRDEELRQKFGCAAREVVRKELDIHRCADRHLTAYSEILGL